MTNMLHGTENDFVTLEPKEKQQSSDLVSLLRTACGPETPLGKLFTEAANMIEILQIKKDAYDNTLNNRIKTSLILEYDPVTKKHIETDLRHILLTIIK